MPYKKILLTSCVLFFTQLLHAEPWTSILNLRKLMNSCTGFNARRLHDQVLERVHRDVTEHHFDIREISNNGSYYTWGDVGEPHEVRMAERYAAWLKVHFQFNFFFLPGVEKILTPAIDGIVFDHDPQVPLARVSFKALEKRLTRETFTTKVHNVLWRANSSAYLYSHIEDVIPVFFPRMRADKQYKVLNEPDKVYRDKIALLSVMGLRNPVTPPLHIVLQIDDPLFPSMPESIKAEFSERLQKIDMQPKPSAVIIITKDGIVDYLLGRDY